jgi:hypothetical protein
MSVRLFAVMVIKSVLFSGPLNDENVLLIDVDETYCARRAGHWRLRLDSLCATTAAVLTVRSVVAAVGCSLVQSPQLITRVEQNPRRKVTVREICPTPLHVFVLDADTEELTQQVMLPCTREWFNFSNGTQTFELQVRDVRGPYNGAHIAMAVHGVLLFEYLA